MSPHYVRPRAGLHALGVFLWECAKDRPRGALPLRDMTDAEDIAEFHEGLERLLRAILLDYSVEKRQVHLAQAFRTACVARTWQ